MSWSKRGVSRKNIAFVLCRVVESEAEIQEARDYMTQAGYAVSDGAVLEKIAYRRASHDGRILTETRFASLNERGDQLAQGINHCRKRIRDLLGDVARHFRRNGPWRYELGSVYETPDVQAEYRKLRQQTANVAA